MPLTASRFHKTLVYNGKGEVRSLQQDLQRIRGWDAESERQQRRWFWIMLGALLGGGALTIAMLAQDYMGFAAVLGLPSLGGFIYSLIEYRRFKRTNIDNRRYGLASQVLDLIDADLARGLPVQLDLDFQRFDLASKLDRKGKAGAWNVKYYIDPWLRLSGRFADGTTFSLVKQHLHQHRSRWKTSRSGKRKHKSKTKTGLHIEVRLKYKPEKYRHMAQLQDDAQAAVQLPPGVQFKRMRYSDQEIGMRATYKGDWGVREGRDAARKGGAGIDATHVIAMMFLSLYQILNLNKAIDKSASAGGTA